MLLKDHLADMGEFLFRRRSFVLTVFIPIVLYETWQGEAIELRLGDTVGGLYESLCLLLVFAGLAMRAYTVGYVPARTSGRNTKGQVAESLNTTGIYSAVRNPLYLGNSLTYIGVALYPQYIWVGAAMAGVLVFYFERIIAAEERFLLGKFGEEYSDWAARTPAFFPSFRNWQPAALPFSWRSVIRREHPTWLGAISIVYVLELISVSVEGESIADQTGWHILFTAAIIGQITVMVLKQKTTILQASGR